MNLNRFFETVRASKNVSHAVKEGRTPAQHDLVALGLVELFDARQRTR
ncbi:MAG: hypothetical protein NXI27_08620 [Alphaproteobacteria bacterium]|nr:hypothetical protein [Alphaproteobacteria bacterium]